MAQGMERVSRGYAGLVSFATSRIFRLFVLNSPRSEYMLWTDETSREFVKTYYPAHLEMFDSYKYPIQRADSIRYFVLHHFGGVYMDLDIGCRRRLDPLLQGDWDAILPITKPVSHNERATFYL